jgi:hypothetical protein
MLGLGFRVFMCWKMPFYYTSSTVQRSIRLPWKLAIGQEDIGLASSVNGEKPRHRTSFCLTLYGRSDGAGSEREERGGDPSAAMASMLMLVACAHFPHGLRCFSGHGTPCPSVFRLHRSTVLRSTPSAGVKKKRNAMCCGSAHQDGDSPGFQFSISNKEDGGEKNASLEQQQQQQQNQRHRVLAELQEFQVRIHFVHVHEQIVSRVWSFLTCVVKQGGFHIWIGNKPEQAAWCL